MSVVGRSHWFDRSRPTSALPRSTDAHETGPVSPVHATTGLMHRSKLECSAAAWGPFKEFELVANRASSPNYSRASHITVPGHSYRSGFVARLFSRCGPH